MSIFPNSFLNFLTKNTQTILSPKISLEQYSTPIPLLNEIFSNSIDFNNKIVLDMGVGLGSLSFCAAWLGAKSIIGIDSDREIFQSLKKNEKFFLNLFLSYQLYSQKEKNFKSKNNKNITNPVFSWIHSQIEFFQLNNLNNKINIVIMNPPFGTQRKGIDFVFLRQAAKLRCPILSLHKYHSNFNKKLADLLRIINYKVKWKKKLEFPIKNSMDHHALPLYVVETLLLLIEPV
ncbi:MAG: hypothetical protein HeimC3_32950 [Candidatus Heimdallarchaeota archaeon LC_3]|nr:MAG: hypothetical protein HeimC3_32950 [Candidatus Heimdallarchaeota archaeon LC_3]